MGKSSDKRLGSGKSSPFILLAGLWSILAGCENLLGYAAGRPGIARVVPTGPLMQPMTAIALSALGVALLLVAPRDAVAWRVHAARVLGLLVALCGVVVLLEHATGRSAGIDLLLFPAHVREWTSSGAPGRPSAHCALGFLFLGLTLAFLDAHTGRYRPARLLASGTVLVAMTAVLGYAYGLRDLQDASAATGMALVAAVTFAVLSAGIMVCRPELPPAPMFAGPGPGAVMVRWLGPVAAGTVMVVGLLTGLSGTPAPVQTVAVLSATVTLVAVMYVVLRRVHAELDRAEGDQRALIEALREERDFSRTVMSSLRDGIMTVSANGRILHVSPRWCEITGFAAHEVLGVAPPYPWRPAADLTETPEALAARPSHVAHTEGETRIRHRDGRDVDILVVLSRVNSGGRLPVHVVTYRDITDSKRAEAERLRAAAELRHFFTMSTDLLSIIDAGGRFKRLSTAWERTLGFPADEMLGRSFLEFLHPDDMMTTIAASAEQLMRSGNIRDLENRYRHRDGGYRWLSWNSTVARNDGLTFAAARDFTTQRETNRARALLAAIVDSTSDAIVGTALDGTIVCWNAAAERTYGYPAGEVIGRSLRLFTPDDRVSEIDTSLEHAGRGESVDHHDTVRLRKDGTRIHVALTVSPIHDDDSSIMGAAFTARDITERIKAEERFRRLVDLAPVAMVIFDRDGTIVLANNQTNSLFGYPRHELVGEPIERLIPHRSHPDQVLNRHGYLATPEPHHIGAGREMVALRRDGSEFPVEISLAPLDTDQGTLVSAAILDLTQRRQVEQALGDARDKAVAAGQLKSQFVAMVSHEIRTPMNGVLGLTRLLLHTPLQPDQRRYAESIRTSGGALLAIINDILDFSKIEAGKIELVDDDFDLHRLLDDVIQVAAETARAKDLEVLGYYAPSLLRAMRGDAGRLRQILLNLLGNAVKFTEHGEVLLRADPAPDAEGGRLWVTFTAIDTGIGIAAIDLPRLFEPFSQADAAPNRQFGGTGLGLAICRQLIELMGGRLDVVSAPGHGSRFSFTIPLTPQPHRPRHRANTHLQLIGRRLLVIDTNPRSLGVLAEHIQAWGMNAAIVADNDEALDRMRQAAGRDLPYHVVLIDQSLAVVNGVQFADRVLADPGIPPTRLVLLTSGRPTGHPVTTAVVLLAKPIGPSALYNCLVAALSPARDVRAERVLDHDRAAGDRADLGLVLLAEDNEINQMVALDTLAELGYRADVAHNGIEALQLARSGTYLAILMDCQMPTMDGYAATIELRRREGLAHHVPIIAMTAGALAEDRQRCLDVGMDDYLAKPIDPEELRATLSRWTTIDHGDVARASSPSTSARSPSG